MLTDNEIVGRPNHSVKVEDVEYLGGLRLRLAFDDGAVGEFDFTELTKQPVFESLADPEKFIQFGLEHGTLVWSDALDISPEYLRSKIQ